MCAWRSGSRTRQSGRYKVGYGDHSNVFWRFMPLQLSLKNAALAWTVFPRCES